jgi:hypothetical protein
MFVVQNIRYGDQPQRDHVTAFLADNPDPGVRLRPEAQLDLALNSGHGLTARRDGGIQAVSLVYQFGSESGPVDYEIGTMRVVAEGLGLQVFFACLHLVQIFLEDVDTRGEVFAVVSPGSASEHNLRGKVGMAEWTPSTTLAIRRGEAGVPFVEGKSVLKADLNVIAGAFERMRQWHVGGSKFQTPKGDETIALELGWFRPDILNLGP